MQSQLHMDGLEVSSQASLLESLTQSWVRVASSGDILAGSTILHSQDSFSQHFSRVSSNDVDTQNSISLLISQNLDKSLSVIVSFRSGVSKEGEGSLRVLTAYSNELQLIKSIAFGLC